MRKLHVTNAQGRDATVESTPVALKPQPRLGIPNGRVEFRRYLATTEQCVHEALAEQLGEDYGQALVDGDPEIDMEQVGQRITGTDVVFLSSEGDVLHAAPEVVEVILAPDGSERERREPIDTAANVNEGEALRWSKKRLKRGDAVRRFAFKRSLQLRHVDGLSYDYLHAMAKTLDDADEMVYIGAGAKGRDALVFQSNGTPYRGFLEGRVDGSQYKLVLHLSNMELKLPEGGS